MLCHVHLAPDCPYHLVHDGPRCGADVPDVLGTAEEGADQEFHGSVDI
jgi:hypothetical protein